MLSTWKYMLLMALALPAIYAYAPLHLGDVTKSGWVDNIEVFITRSLAAMRPATRVSPVDPVAAANVNEDLDYRIAQRTKSIEGWRAFLTAHPDGPHAQLARVEVDQLISPPAFPAAVAAQAVEASSSDTKAPAEATSPAGPPAARSDVATPASDEICSEDEERLERLADSLTSDGVIRFLIELRCERLRPELLRLAERVDDKPPAAAGAAPSAPSIILPGPVVSAPPLPPPRMRADDSKNGTRSTLGSRGAQTKRHANPWSATNLPQLLVALFGEGPRSSAGVRRTRAGGGPNGGGR
jgi:hypothetical protein